jgi:hypothetical protein
MITSKIPMSPEKIASVQKLCRNIQRVADDNQTAKRMSGNMERTVEQYRGLTIKQIAWLSKNARIYKIKMPAGLNEPLYNTPGYNEKLGPDASLVALIALGTKISRCLRRIEKRLESRLPE